MPNDQPLLPPRGRTGDSFANALRENLASAVVFVSAADESLLLSPEASRLLGLDGRRAPVTDIDLPAPLLALVRQGLAGCPVTARQIKFPAGGRELEVDLSVVPLMSGREIESVLLVLNDVAAAHEFEAHLDHINQLANAGTLGAGMAHEIKNALVAGKTFVDLLLEQHRDNELAETVRYEMERIDGIVGRMLKLAAPGDGSAAFTRVNVHELLDHVLRLVQPELGKKGIELERSLAAEPDSLMGDGHRLQQALLNLLLNSIEALPAGGKISIGTCVRTSNRDGEPPRLCLTVQDNGTGIPLEHLARVFEPFFTTKPGGTGLGLAITRRIIGEHGGHIEVHSPPGSGARFEILLPV